MAKKIVSVGIEIPGCSDDYLSVSSDQSLLDFDIIVFNPDISGLLGYVTEYHQGKPCLSDGASFTLTEKTRRWKQELLTAFQHGKTIFIYMSELKEVLLDTGKRDYSGSGRNRVTTKHVNSFNNFNLLPFDLGQVTAARGREMRPAKELGVLAPYWNEFGSSSQYEVYFESEVVTPILVTKTGNKTVAGMIRSKSPASSGAIVLLPPVRYDAKTFVETKEHKQYWTKAGVAFGHRWRTALIEIDAAISSQTQKTPPPEWTKNAKFRLASETSIQGNIQKTNRQLETLQNEKQRLLEKLENEGSLRHLLYESGPLLEDAVLKALQVLGLKAERFKDPTSEFDVIFTWQGRRFLGEVEGKDSKQINVDKISQLERNLSEDFTREGVSEYAKGVLFGNAFRLQELAPRGYFFTEKCVSTAERIKAALVRTPDLFFVARYVKESGDTEFGKKCIEAIASAQGTLVSFPAIPQQGSEIVVEEK